MSLSTPAYRPDIDGIRALAVGLVVLHHVDVPWLPGGYIGVDVFFVISGYLITSVITPKMVAGTFSLKDFFIRRVKRLSPVLTLVVFASLFVGTFILLPSDLENLGLSAISVSLFAGNFFFWRNYGGYFADDAQTAPLLHTWSLAVEEQYYLLWPLSLMIAIRVLGFRNTVLLFTISLPPLIYLSELGTQITLGAAYYLLPTRLFELLAGSVLALLLLPQRAKHTRIAKFSGPIGLVLIIYAAVSLTPNSTFPGYQALWPVIGSVLLIMSSSTLTTSLFSNGIVVYLGKLSYSLYLWHWPIIAYMHYMGMPFTAFQTLAAIGGALLCSILSFHLIENPLRYRDYSSRWQIFLWLYLAPTALIASITVGLIATNGLSMRFDPTVIDADNAINLSVQKSRKSCHAPARDWSRPLDSDCVFGETKGTASLADILLVGDSHANHLVPFLDQLISEKDLSGADYTMDRCPPLIGLQYGASAVIARQCAKRNFKVAELLQSKPYKYVVLAASWPDETTRSIFRSDDQVSAEITTRRILTNALRNTIDKVLANGAIPVIIRETPTLRYTTALCPLQTKLFSAELDCRAEHKPNRWLDQTLPILKEEFPQLIVVDPARVLCEAHNRCAVTLNEVPIYIDDNHFNFLGSIMLGRRYKAQLGNPFSQQSEAPD